MDAQAVEPHLFIVFGGTGDLMRRKLLPALYRLAHRGRLGEQFQILAVARSERSDENFRALAVKALEQADLDPGSGFGAWCDACLHYFSLGEQEEADFRRLRERIEALEAEYDLPGNRIFYLALGPESFPHTIQNLGAVGLNTGPGDTRLVVEKPFGRDLDSAHALNELIHRHFEERQVYRIDHYLGKETVQNLLVFRFANPMFETVWNRDRIQNVQITVAESIGVDERGGYYDTAGALRDMVQNHLTQLLTLTAMEAPAAFDADAIRDEKVKVLRSLSTLKPQDAVFGQYTHGSSDGAPVAAYREADGVPDDSTTETFVALRLYVNNWRWQGVPFYLRTGKHLKQRLTQITVNFKTPPVSLFQTYDQCRLHSNALVLTLQPNEGFALQFDVKRPGEGMDLETRELRFAYRDAFGPLPDGYETLLYDILTDDQTLFVRADEVESSWRFYAPLLEHTLPLHLYEPGSWGPRASFDLLGDNGDRWLMLP